MKDDEIVTLGKNADAYANNQTSDSFDWKLIRDARFAQLVAAAQEPFGYFKAEPFGWRDCADTDEGAIALYEAPQPQADALDAERWRFIKRKLCLTGNGDGTCSMQALNLPARILGWPDVGELAIAQFVDAAIDAAIAAAKEI